MLSNIATWSVLAVAGSLLLLTAGAQLAHYETRERVRILQEQRDEALRIAEQLRDERVVRQAQRARRTPVIGRDA